MNRGIYAVASGMVASQQAMDTVSNNLANVNTSGFKQDQVMFNDMLERSITAADGTPLGTLGSGATIKGQYTDLAQGSVRDTSNPFDLAVQGKGMFAVLGSDGKVQYTRDGEFTLSDTGQLVTQEGLPVLDNSLKPIQMKSGPMHVSSGGAISQDGDGTPYAQIGLFKGTFSKSGSGIYDAPDASALSSAAPGAPKLKQGSVEGSNVNPIPTMVQMISLQRTYDMSQKAIQSQDSMTQRLTTVLTSM